MATPKPFASLSSGLLARKGGARPAMRPQAYALATPASPPATMADDLGWNDMGLAAAGMVEATEPVVAERPPVLVERDALAQRIEAPAVARPVSVATAARLRRETRHAGKAALTVRLDAERHLELRLASAITNRSAQDLMTQALDALIGSLPTVAALVAQLPPAKLPPAKPQSKPKR